MRRPFSFICRAHDKAYFMCNALCGFAVAENFSRIGDERQDKVEVINPERNSADAMASRVLGEINNLFDRAAAGEDLTGKRDGQLITKMVAVAGQIMNEENPKDVVLGAFLGRVNRPARRAAANVRAAFLKLTADK